MSAPPLATLVSLHCRVSYLSYYHLFSARLQNEKSNSDDSLSTPLRAIAADTHRQAADTHRQAADMARQRLLEGIRRIAVILIFVLPLVPITLCLFIIIQGSDANAT